MHKDGGQSIIDGMYRRTDSLKPDRRTGERRRRHVYVFHDRRSGFDRRHQHRGGVTGLLQDALVTLRDNPAALRVLLLVINALNLFDFGFTLNALSIGAREANPVMASLFDASPVWAGLFKTAAVLVATAIVWECKRYRKALAAGVMMLLVFAAVFLYHVVGLSLYA
jgi:hypothetical protein